MWAAGQGLNLCSLRVRPCLPLPTSPALPPPFPVALLQTVVHTEVAPIAVVHPGQAVSGPCLLVSLALPAPWFCAPLHFALTYPIVTWIPRRSPHLGLSPPPFSRSPQHRCPTPTDTRARTRDMFCKDFRKAGQAELSKYFITYKIGDIVDIKCDGSVHRGMPHKFYHGRTGVVFNVTRNSVGIEVNKVVRGNILKKRIHVRIEHCRPSKCRLDFLKRVKENEQKKKAAKAAGKKIVLKRIPGQPRGVSLSPSRRATEASRSSSLRLTSSSSKLRAEPPPTLCRCSCGRGVAGFMFRRARAHGGGSCVLCFWMDVLRTASRQVAEEENALPVVCV